jgi:hypothetical protein
MLNSCLHGNDEVARTSRHFTDSQPLPVEIHFRKFRRPDSLPQHPLTFFLP